MMRDLFDLTGKKAMVTGGAGDLGQGMVDGLVQSGAEVVILDLSDKAEEIAANYRAQGFPVSSVKVNVADREDVKRAFAEALQKLGGKIDIMVNAAGIQRRHPCEEFPIEDWDAVIEINLTAVFEFTQLAGREMLKVGYGKIINIASMLTFFGGYTVPAYAASKGGVAQVSKAFSNEWAGKGINVNCIAPGYMDTQMNVNLVNVPVRNKEILDRIPAHRWGTGDDVKGAIVFLASPASDYIDGVVIPVDGGYLAR